MGGGVGDQISAIRRIPYVSDQEAFFQTILTGSSKGL